MLIPIKYSTQRDFYQKYLTFLNPLIKLNNTENIVLSSFLTLNDKYRHYNKEVLNKLLFSEDTKKSIQQRLHLTEKQFNKSFTALTNKKYITPEGINQKFLYPVLKKDKSISIVFEREVKDEQ